MRVRSCEDKSGMDESADAKNNKRDLPKTFEEIEAGADMRGHVVVSVRILLLDF